MRPCKQVCRDRHCTHIIVVSTRQLSVLLEFPGGQQGLFEGESKASVVSASCAGARVAFLPSSLPRMHFHWIFISCFSLSPSFLKYNLCYSLASFAPTLATYGFALSLFPQVRSACLAESPFLGTKERGPGPPHPLPHA